MNDFEQRVIELYNDQNYSTYQIAKDLNTYPNKIRRILIRHGYTLKDRSSAQKVALETGRSKHPTKGRQRSKEEKMQISTKLVEHWEQMSEHEKNERAEVAKKNWANMTEEQREAMRSKGVAAIRAAASEGSKLEKFFKERLEEAGFLVEIHKLLIPAENLEIDLYIPELKTIIEVDGPSHFFPIWGEEKLQKQMNADLRKSGVMLSKGYAVIRVKSLGQESLAKREQLIEEVLDHLSKIKKSFPPRNKRFIEVE